MKCLYFSKNESVSHSVMSESLWPYGLQPTRLLCPWDPPGKNTRVGSHSVLQGIFLTQGQMWVSCITGKFFTILATREEYLNRNQMIWLEPRFRHICDSEQITEFFLNSSSFYLFCLPPRASWKPNEALSMYVWM